MGEDTKIRFLFQRETAGRIWRFVGATLALSLVGFAGTIALKPAWRRALRTGLATRRYGVPRIAVAAAEIIGEVSVPAGAGQKALFDIDTYWVKKLRTGCHNWKSSLLKNISTRNPLQCSEACNAETGCLGFGYQPKMCLGGDDPGHAIKWTCYLWSEPCDYEENTCWDDYELLNPKRAPWTRMSTGSGCADWTSVMLGDAHYMERSANSCGKLCETTAGCRAFAFKPPSCNTSATSLAALPPACILLDSTHCERTPAACYDIYEMTQ